MLRGISKQDDTMMLSPASIHCLETPPRRRKRGPFKICDSALKPGAEIGTSAGDSGLSWGLAFSLFGLLVRSARPPLRTPTTAPDLRTRPRRRTLLRSHTLLRQHILPRRAHLRPSRQQITTRNKNRRLGGGWSTRDPTFVIACSRGNAWKPSVRCWSRSFVSLTSTTPWPIGTPDVETINTARQIWRAAQPNLP